MLKILIILFCFALASCSTFKKRSPMAAVNPIDLQSHLKKVAETFCFSGEGRARVFHEEKKYLVSYSSMLNQEIKQWGVGFEVPLHGEETLVLNWENWPKQPLTIAGSFYERLQNVEKTEFDQKFQENFWNQIFYFINYIEYLKNHPSLVQKVECQGQSDTIDTVGGCEQILANKANQKIVFKTMENEAHFTLSIEEKWKLLIKVFWDKKWQPERLSFLVLGQADSNENASKMGMELFIKACAVR